jgi:hypothetical protein
VRERASVGGLRLSRAAAGTSAVDSIGRRDAAAGLPSGSVSSLLRAAILFAVARKSNYGIFNLILGRGLGQARERVSALLLSCGEAATATPVRLRIGAASASRWCGSCWLGNRRKPTFSPQRCHPPSVEGAAAALRRVALMRGERVRVDSFSGSSVYFGRWRWWRLRLGRQVRAIDLGRRAAEESGLLVGE